MGTISSDKAISTQTMSRWLVHVLTFAGIDTSTCTGHPTGKALTSKAKVLNVPTKETLERGIVKKFTFQKYYCKEIME